MEWTDQDLEALDEYLKERQPDAQYLRDQYEWSQHHPWERVKPAVGATGKLNGKLSEEMGVLFGAGDRVTLREIRYAPDDVLANEAGEIYFLDVALPVVENLQETGRDYTVGLISRTLDIVDWD